MKYLVILFILSVSIQIDAQQCRLTYHIRNIATLKSICFIVNGKEAYIDTSGKMDNSHIFNIVGEPIRAGVVLNGNYKEINNLWLYDYKVDMTVDSNIYNITFRSDLLNTHEQELTKIQKPINIIISELDSILGSLDSHEPDYQIYSRRMDFLEDSLNDLYYYSALNHPGSYASLAFIAYSLGGKGHYDRNMLSHLLSLLSYNLSLYPKYNLCKEILSSKTLLYQIGDTVKPIKLIDNKGLNTNLTYLLKKDYLYIDFWGSRCTYSTFTHEALRRITEDYGDYLDVIGISDDTDYQDLCDYLKTKKCSWRNFCDFKGELSPMFRNFGIDVLPSSVLLNNAGIVVAKDFNAYNAPDILSKIILADQKAKGNYRSKNLILSFNQKDSILNSVMLSKVDSLIDQMKDLLIFDIKLTSNNELTFEQMCDIQEYLISEGIPSSRISSCQRETNNHSENSSDIINRLSCKVILHLEWVPGKIPLKSTASSNNFNNPCGMFGDIRKMNEWEIGDSLFFCYLQLDVHPDDYTLCSSHPETLAELNCLIAIMTKNKNLKFELTMVKSFTAYRPEFGVKSFKTILNYLVSKGIDPNRIKFREVAADINKINFPCARFIINAPIRWYLRIIDV